MMICDHFFRTCVGVVSLCMAMAIPLTHVDAAVVFQDDIEATSFDGIPSTDPWSMNVLSDLSTSTTLGAQVGAVHGLIANSTGGFRSLASASSGPLQAFTPKTELWIEVHSYMATDVADESGRIGIFGDGGTLPVSLDLTSNGDGTYKAQRLASGGFQVLTGLDALPLNTWEHWRFGIKLDTDSPTLGDGTFSVFRKVAGEWQAVVEDQAYSPLSTFTSDVLSSVRIQTVSSGPISFGFDGIVVYDSSPFIPEPGSMGFLVAGAVLLMGRCRTRR